MSVVTRWARITWIGPALFALSLTTWVVWVLLHQKFLWSPLDLDVYRSGGLQLRKGSHLYQRNYTWVHLPFTYPPFSAVVFAAGSYLSYAALKVVMAATAVGGLLLVGWLALGLAGVTKRGVRTGAMFLAAGIGLWLEPVQQTLAFGQVNILLMTAVFADLCFKDQRWWKGVGIGLAAGFKLTPIIFIAYLLVTRRLRAAAVSIATFAATIGLTYAFAPRESGQYWGGIFLDANRIGGVGYVSDQSLNGMITRLLGNTSYTQTVYHGVAVVVLVAGLLLARWAYRQQDVLLSILIAAATGLLVSPISWSHHWVWMVPFLVWFGHRIRILPSRSRLLGAAAIIGLFAAWPMAGYPNAPYLPGGVIWSVPHNNDNELQWPGPLHLLGDLYVLLALAFLVCVAVTAINRHFAEKRGLAESSDALSEVFEPEAVEAAR
jgi:alpha-1,2-mannosyltransferase